MKTTILTVLLFAFGLVVSGQTTDTAGTLVSIDKVTFHVSESFFKAFPKKAGKYIDENKISLSACFIAGIAEGNREILRHDYQAFKNWFPNANENFWNPAYSWKNKWKNGDPSQGEKFFGSTGILVATTDGTHLWGSVRNIAWTTSVTFKIGEKKKWYLYLVDAGTHWISYTAGFNLTYHGFYGHPLFKSNTNH